MGEFLLRLQFIQAELALTVKNVSNALSTWVFGIPIYPAMVRDKLDNQAPLKIAFIHPDLGIGKKLNTRNFAFFKVNTMFDEFPAFRWS